VNAIPFFSNNPTIKEIVDELDAKVLFGAEF
jgi:phosphate acetyltransferase